MKRKSTPSEDLIRSLGAKPSAIPEAAPSNFTKVSVSLFPPDMTAADALMERMRRASGGLVTRSDAFKLALRFAAETLTDAEIRERFAAIKQEDRRNSGNL
ncbi:MAG: hypothetical protein EOP87_00125 [Verrucomicrobiaceae bacterium]|nr:MAG: hypothetical protein EOP87_00125 [Verrucomicrobiaceae bacterium]